MYKWMRQQYIWKIESQLQDAIDNDEIDEDDATAIAEKLVEDWEAGYGDYMYDMMGDR